MLAGLIASPQPLRPGREPGNATSGATSCFLGCASRRDHRAQYEEGIRQSVPDEDEVDPPTTESEQPLLHELDDPAAGGPLRPGRVFGVA